MWINGGPGGSSAMGLFMEQGEFVNRGREELSGVAVRICAHMSTHVVNERGMVADHKTH
jgi:hypothetical protein